MSKKSELYHIEGMHCASCALSIEKHLAKIDGIFHSAVLFVNEQAEITYDSEKVTQSTIINSITQLGYRAKAWKATQDKLDLLEAGDEVALMRIKLIVAVILTTILLIGAMVPWAPAIIKNQWIMLLLATPVQFWVGSRFYISAFSGLRHGITTMDTLIALGSSMAYFYSLFVVLFQEKLYHSGLPVHIYFEAAAAIITFILLGNFLEVRARRRSSQAIRQLMGLQPSKALVFDVKSNAWVEISVEAIVVGDLIRIKPGAQVPVDGVIKRGTSVMNESMITGESAPVRKKEGDEVIGGTISMSSAIEVEATKVGAQTMLAKIIQMVGLAQASKAQVQKLVDTISSVFVPVVIILSVIAFVAWLAIGPEPRFLHAVIASISVLIIACPCALGLATPTSIIVGIGRGAQEGMIIKGADVFEVAGKVNFVVFDKTGTLTRGQQSVQGFRFEKDIEQIINKIGLIVPEGINLQAYLFMFINALEQLSDHPISHAIIHFIDHEKKIDSQQKNTLKVEKFESIEGLGLSGDINGHTILVGSRQLMERNNIPLSQDIDVCAIEWSKEAKSISFVAIDKHVIAYFCVADKIRHGALQAIERLKKNGISCALITGDNQLAANAVAQAVGIEIVLAQVLPGDKAKEIERLRSAGNIVAMVGDGINDAPALAAADVGIAMGSGTDVAIETADITLLRSDIMLVPKVIALSRATRRNIVQNLVFAFGYNIILLPIAMGALYPLFGIILNPILASAAMALSSVSVVLNALRLRRIKL